MSKKSINRCLKFLNNSSTNTKKSYLQTIRKYERFHSTSIEELVREALDEQSNQVPHHLLSIIERIEEFQQNLLDEGYVVGSINVMMGRIKTVYHKNRVEIPYIESVNPKQTNKREYIEYTDILKKDEIIKALPHMRLSAQARVMAMIQGGLSNEECEHLTTRAFIDENYRYHQCNDDVSALRWLADENHPIIWVTKLIRVKTGKPYYALLGAEAVNKIAEAKLYERGLKKNNGEIPSKLLTYHKVSFSRTCIQVNDKLGFGYAGRIHHCEVTDDEGNVYINKRLFSRFEMITDIDYDIIVDEKVIISTDSPNICIEFYVGGQGRFRPHMLRKFHATFIRGSVLSYEERCISNSQIDEMQGRGKTNVQDTYIKTNPLEQKILYAKVMNNVSLFHEYDYRIVDGDVIVSLKNPYQESRELQEKVNELEEKLDKKEKSSQKLNNLRKELGDDTFREIVEGILNVS